MIDESVKKKILSFLKDHLLGVIATIHADFNGPESAVVSFVETDRLELIFGTSNKSRKYKNIQKNNHISFVIGWDSQVGTIQYEGLATELSAEESREYALLQAKKNPNSEKFISRQEQRYFIVKPTWIRLIDNRETTPSMSEINF